MQRRFFLQQGLAQAAAMGSLMAPATRLWAAPGGRPAATDPRFLLVFLRGGYDALSLLVPTERTFYDEQRPGIAVPAQASRAVAAAAAASASALGAGAGAGGGTGAAAAPWAPHAVPLSADWALHPAVLPALGPLLARRQVCWVPFAGTHNNTRSHFDTQDSIELGLDGALADARGAALQSGFMNRLAAVTGQTALAFTEQLPVAMRGPVAVANIAPRNAAGGTEAAALRAAMQAMYRDTPLQARVDSAFELREALNRQMADERRAATATATAMPAAPGAGPAGSAASASAAAAGTSPGTSPGMATMAAAPSANAMAEMAAASRNAPSPRGFELEVRRIGRLMAERCTLGFVELGGWDTHVNQGAATGALANRFEELSRGLAALPEALGEAVWQRTVVVVVSEFGRTLRENGTRGTDHGHGSVHWVLGGGLQGAAPVRGEQVPVAARHLHEARDLPVLNPYRGLLAGVLARQFGLSVAQLQQVFDGVQPLDLGLV